MNIRKDRLDPYGHLVVIKLKNTNQYGILKDKTYFTEETPPYILYTVLLYLGSGYYEEQMLRATQFDVVKIYDYNNIYPKKDVRKDRLNPKNKFITVVDTISKNIGVLLYKYKKDDENIFKIDCCDEDGSIIECKAKEFNVIDIFE